MSARPDLIERLAARARQEQPPTVDVSRRVVWGLTTDGAPWERILGRFALASLAPAALGLAFGLVALQDLSDPLNHLFGLISSVLIL